MYAIDIIDSVTPAHSFVQKDKSIDNLHPIPQKDKRNPCRIIHVLVSVTVRYLR